MSNEKQGQGQRQQLYVAVHAVGAGGGIRSLQDPAGPRLFAIPLQPGGHGPIIQVLRLLGLLKVTLSSLMPVIASALALSFALGQLVERPGNDLGQLVLKRLARNRVVVAAPSISNAAA
jgi:hypothetical protein